MKLTLELELLSYWHVGTGRGSGVGFDAVVFRTAGGLPCIPGKQLKGLLRSAVELCEQIGAYGADIRRGDLSVPLFGTGIESPPQQRGETRREEALESARFRTEPGWLRFASAVIGDSEESANAWEAWAADQPENRELLFREFASTKLDDSGMAADHSLRSIEVAVPMTLRTQISSPDVLPASRGTARGWAKLEAQPDAWTQWIVTALPYVEAAGGHRTRGLGRLEIRRVP